MESPTQQIEAEPLSSEKSAVEAEGRELTARDTSSQLDEDHVRKQTLLESLCVHNIEEFDYRFL